MKHERRHANSRSVLCAFLVGLVSTAALASDDTVAPGTASGTITSPSTCVTVPIELLKGSPATFVRAYKISFQLSSELMLCDPDLGISITAGTWAGGAGSSLFRTDLGGGSYRVEQTILGGPLDCPDTGGSLFDIHVTATVTGTTSGTITVTGVVLRDCDNNPLNFVIGAPGSVPIDIGPPPPIVLYADQKLTGNVQPPAGTTDIILSWDPNSVAPGHFVEIWRAPFGNYPIYDGYAKATASSYINFQPLAATIPSGYTPDYGDLYAGGMGWNVDMRASMFSRNVASTDPDYSFVRRLNDGSAVRWDYAIADGSHEVIVMCGDPLTTSTPYVVVEGTTLFDGNTTLDGPSLFEGRTTTVSVSDGYLSMWIGGAIPGRPDLVLTETKVTRIVISDATGGGPGSVPILPSSYPPDPPWENLGIQDSGDVDRDSERDEWYFVAFVKDSGGQVSDVSNMTDGTLNYHLGDVFVHGGGAGTPAVPGDNEVFTPDISHLGFYYGETVSPVDLLEKQICDIGPTAAGGFATRPQTDAMVEFEDLVVLSGNYSEVSKQRTIPASASADVLSVEAPSEVSSGERFAAVLRAAGAGDILAMSVALGWDADVVEPIGIAAGELLTLQNGVALTPRPGVVDLAILGAAGTGLAGEGIVATVLFRAVTNGDPRIDIESIDARDLDNRPIEVRRGQPSNVEIAPSVTALMHAAPNPFNPSTTLYFTVADRGPVEMTIYAIDGRKVRTLFHSVLEPGLREFLWDGTDDRGIRVASGQYRVRLVAGSEESVLGITLLK